MTISTGVLRIFFSHGRQLIPISSEPPHPLKRPLHSQWQEREYSHEEITGYATRGLNLGWRLGVRDVVIDIDPRNGGLDGMSKLLSDFREHDNDIEDLGDVFPAVRTGGGGFHFYASFDGEQKIRNTIERYGLGVEFKTLGRQVIIPGSRHPSGGVYEFDDFSDYSGPATPLPPWLVKLIVREPKKVKTVSADDAEISPAQLADLLRHLPTTEYGTNDEWFPLMAAAHEATGGAGLEAFIAWSLSDSSFAGHDRIIRNRWESFEPGRSGNIGVGTLYKEVVRHGGELPALSTKNLAQYGLDGDLPPAPAQTTVDAPVVVRHADKAFVDSSVAAMTPVTTADEIRDLLELVARMDGLDHDAYVQAIATNTTRPPSAVKKALQTAKTKIREIDGVTIDDAALEVTTHLLQKRFADGRHLVHGADQRFWHYVGTHWSRMEDNIIENLLLKASYQYRQNNPHVTIGLSSLMAQSEKILRARRAVGQNLHETLDGRPPVVNTKNCEVWIDPNTGELSVKHHSPDSWLTSCLPVEFDPHASCPLFQRALKEMFEPCFDRDDVIRHLWEIMGYVIQPQKDLASWVLFRGEGANGKTVVLNVLTALLGDASLNKPIDELSTKHNNHAFADLPGKLCVIDEDLDTDTVLPDSALKKISESKMLTANPKMMPTFQFRNTAIPIFASNPWPRVKDLSNGMRRRAHVFEFQRIFAESEQDNKLGQRIIDTELAGVLTEALRGFRRLRRRGGWAIPKSCVAARQQWLTRSNTVGEFLGEMIDTTPNQWVEFSKVYSVYRLWCVENSYKHQITKPAFRKALEALGYAVDRGTGNRMVVRHVTINQTEYQFA